MNLENEETMTRKAFAYLRVSGKGQIDKGGYDRQIKTIMKFAASEGWEITQTFKEQISGVKEGDSRPIFMQMVGEIDNNGCKTIIVESLDRLAREYRVQEGLIAFLAARGIDLINATTGENISAAMLESPTGKLLVQLQGCIAEYEKSQIVLRLKAGRAKKRKETGRCGGALRYGQNEHEREVLNKIIFLRRKRKGHERTSYEKIAAILNAEGYYTRNNRAWTTQLVWNVLNGIEAANKRKGGNK